MMWSAMLFLVVGMFFIGGLLSLVGVPEFVWANLIAISWLLTPLVFVAWLVVAAVRLLRSRRQ